MRRAILYLLIMITSLCAETLVWNIANDFRIAPEGENPNRDQYGNAGVWKFLYDTDISRDGSYTAFPYFNDNPGDLGASSADGWSVSSGSPVPTIFKATGTSNPYGIPLEVGKIYMHPGNPALAVLGWQAPVSFLGQIHISGTFASVHGGGVAWYIDKGTSSLTSGAVSNYSSQNFSLDTLVNQGDILYFIVDPNGPYYADTTRLDLVITGEVGAVPEPSTFLLVVCFAVVLHLLIRSK